MKLRLPYLGLLLFPFAAHFAGEYLNVLAISVNHGIMPFALNPYYASLGMHPGDMFDHIHRVMIPTDHLKMLCDIIQRPNAAVESIGDELIDLGNFLKTPVIYAWFALTAAKIGSQEK